MSEWYTNSYAGRCYKCHAVVPPYASFYRREADDKNRVYCATHKLDAEMADDRALVETLAVANKAAAPPITIDEAMLAPLLLDMGEAMAERMAASLAAIVQAEVMALQPKEVLIAVGSAPKVAIDTAHAMLPTIVQACANGANPFLVGPAGSGKTTLAKQVAQALGLKFYMASRVTAEHKLMGFTNANGVTNRTQFREAFEHGGVFLFDEVDASDPDVMTAFNAALDNGLGDFPDGMVRRHAKFYALAAGNTYGRGADRQYVGRNQLDAATLDRFDVFELDYDEKLETTLAGNAKWSAYVQRVRAAVEREKVRHIVSPRASIRGARMLAGGMEWKAVENATIWKGLAQDARQRVEYAMVPR